MEHCSGFSLSDIIKKENMKLTERLIAKIIKQILYAIAFMRERNVMHRDLKLENIIVDGSDTVKIIDFTWAIQSKKKRKSFCGTLEYICPQMVKDEEYGHEVDTYCVGIVMYELFYFKSPFIAET